MRTSSLTALALASSLLLSGTAHALVPETPPSGAASLNNRGIFADYFTNLATGCSANTVLVDFDNTSGANYLKPDCRGINSILGGYFSSLGITSGPVVFNSDGTASVLDYTASTFSNTLTTNLFSNNNYTTALTTWINNNSSSLNMQSQWKNVINGIAYTGGNVAINSNDASFAPFYVAGKSILGNPSTNYVPSGRNWNYATQINGNGTASIGFHDALNGNASSIRYSNNGFTIGADDGWGIKSLTLPGNLMVNGLGNFGTSTNGYTQVLYSSLIGGEIRANPSLGGNGRLNLNWLAGNGGVHVGNGSSSYGDLYARNLNATTQLCLAGSCITNFSSIGGSKWTDIAGGAISRNSNITVVGNVTANGFLYSSDRNLKKNIKPLEGSLKKIMKLSGYSYDWKSTGKGDMGIIAQEVESVYPDLVHTDANGIKSVEYANLIAPLIEAMKTQQKEIEALKAEVKALKK